MSKMARVANYRQTSGQNDILKQNVDFNKDCKLEKKISTPAHAESSAFYRGKLYHRNSKLNRIVKKFITN